MDPSENPFIDVEGIYNFRDIGGYTIDQDPLYSVRRGFIFRCANTGKVKPNGMEKIRDLGITTIFDLRSTSEIERTQDFAPTTAVPGVKRVHVSLFDGEYPTQQTIENLKKYATDNLRERSYVGLIENAKDAFRTIFTHIRDHPSEGCIIFCNGGKNRTGVAIALILAAAGLDYPTIEREYTLSKEGLEPMTESLVRYLSAKSGSEWTTERVSGLLSLRLEELSEMNGTLQDKYDGAEGYLKTQCGFSDQDLTTIKRNLRVRAA